MILIMTSIQISFAYQFIAVKIALLRVGVDECLYSLCRAPTLSPQ